MGSRLSQSRIESKFSRSLELPLQWEIRQSRTRVVNVEGDVSAAVISPSCLQHNGSNLFQRCSIHALPVELLAHIFELCLTRGGLSQYSVHDHLSKMTFREAPFKLLSVCRLWRSVAFETPTLWDSICPSQNSVAFMQKWLRIAPKIPFHFKLAITPQTLGYDTSKYPLKTLQLFLTSSRRWKSLELQFDLNASSFTPDLFQVIQMATQDLQVPLHFLVTIYRGGFHPQIESIFSALSSTTSIERFRWKNCTRFPRDSRPSFQQLPGKGIKTLEILHPASTAEFVGYLMQCEEATTVKLVQSHWNHKPISVPVLSPYCHQYLISLSLSSGTNPMAILERFTFPTLHKLCIGISNRDRFTFNDFLTRTPNLETLLIHENDVDDYSLRYYLSSTAMRRIPNVRVTFKHASKLGVRTVKENLQLFNSLPALVCWRQSYDDNPERLPNNDTKPVVFVGWGEGSMSRRVWIFYHGVLEFRTKTVLL